MKKNLHNLTSFLSGLFILVLIAGSMQRTKTSTADIQAEVKQTFDVERESELSGGAYELGGGESRYYGIVLPANWYIKINVTERSTDVSVKLFGPDGKLLKEVVQPDGIQGTKYLNWISQSSGRYTLQIQSKNAKAARGVYELAFERSLPANNDTRNYITAEILTSEGWMLDNLATAESLRQAIEKYRQAAPFAHLANQPQQEAQNFMFWGLAHSKLGEYKSAIDLYLKSVPLFVRAEDKNGVGWAFNQLGSAYRDSGEPYNALDYYQKALVSYKEKGENSGLGIVLTNLGAIYVSIGEKQKALDHFDQALYYWHADHENKEGEARVNYRKCELFLSLGDALQALDPCNEAQRLWQLTGEPTGVASALNETGRVYLLLGDIQRATGCFTQALDIRRTASDRRGEAYTLIYLGVLGFSQSQINQSLEFLTKAQKIFNEIGDKYGEARSLNYLGVVSYSSGETGKAESYFNEALALRRVASDKEGEAETLYNIARIKRDGDELDEARDLIENSIRMVESVRASVTDEELRAIYLSTVQDYYEFYTDLLMRLHEKRPGMGLNLLALQSVEMARARSLVDMLVRNNIDLEKGAETPLLSREHQLEQTLRAKMNRNTELYGKIGEIQYRALTEEVASLTTEYLNVREEVRLNSPRYADLTQPRPLNAERIQQLLDQNTLLLEYALGSERSFLWLVSSNSVTTFELPKRDQIESVALRAYNLLTERNRTVKGETAEQRRNRIEQSEQEYKQVSVELSRILLRPVDDRLEKKRLVLVTQGALQFIPFAALPDPSIADDNPIAIQQAQDSHAQPLIVKHEIVTMPSASTLALIRRDLVSRKPALKTVAVFADPVFSANDERLRQRNSETANSVAVTASDTDLRDMLRDIDPSNDDKAVTFRRLFNTRWEAEQITSLVPADKRKVALDFLANCEAARNPDLGRYRIVHFATHAFLDNVRPERSGLVLSLLNKNGNPQDGYLRVRDIYNLKLPVDLVVLSSCRTNIGKDIRGEGLINLTRGFMYAGAATVMGSLWSVDDVATSDLMVRFYQDMLGKKSKLSPPAALRAAQMELWRSRKWSSPYYWAGFVLQGEWR
ncbi:MAG TPA: CHAT domain-containing protein [Blastocatellia bacterium]|nr:CHAT domain-containing protein [Blastocatellia bacterium]